MTTIEIKYKTLSKWLLLIVCICILVIIYLLKFDRCGLEQSSLISKYEKQINDRDSRLDSLEEQNGILEDKVENLEVLEERVNFKYNELKTAYDRKSRLDKNNQADKRFNGKNSLLKHGSILVCFDSTGIDSINKLAMEYDRVNELLPIKDSVINTQASIISNDSLAKEDLNRKFERAENYARAQKTEADYQKQGKKFWMGLSATLAVFQAAIIYIAVTR